MDVLIADDRGERMFSIQVKTRTQAARAKGWPMHKKHESIAGKRLFHVFVDLSKPLGEVPDYFVIPSEIVAKVVRETHAAWVRNPGRKGQQRSLTNDMRSIQSDYASVYTVEEPGFVLGWLDEFKESWHYFDP